MTSTEPSGDHRPATPESREKELRLLLETIPVMSWTATEEGELDFISPQFSDYTGCPTEDTLAWQAHIHPDDLPSVERAWERCVRSGAPYNKQFRLRSSRGTYRWFAARATAREHQGRIEWFGSTTDIHLQKRAELRLKREAVEKNRFIALLSHELRNPLAAIALSHESLRRTSDDPERRHDMLELLGGQISHLSRLVDDTLEITRLESGRMELRKERVELDPLIHEGVEAFRAEAELAEISLSLSSNCPGVILDADPVRIAQCLANLLTNAAKFTPPGGSIEVETSRVDELATIRVTDTGAGIPKGEVSRIFQPFEQGSAAEHATKGGLGLGLSVVRSLIALHGGAARAKSAGAGQGATFEFTLPVAEISSVPTPQDTTPEVPSESGATAATADILIIEDNPSVAKALELMLELDGHQTRHAGEGETAFRLLAERKPDLILCDLGLPGGWGGLDIARKVREDLLPDDRPLMIALTGYAGKEDAQRALASGFDYHLAKPPEVDRLRELISKATTA